MALSVAYEREFTETEKKFHNLAEKLRDYDVVFEWHEVSRKTFQFEDLNKVEYVLEIADPTFKTTWAGYGDTYVIARVCPYEATTHNRFYPYAGQFGKWGTVVSRTIDDNKTSYHLYYTSALYVWDEVASSHKEGTLSVSQVSYLIQNIIDEDRSKEVKELIKKLQYKDAEHRKIEDYLDDITDYAG